ncbi:MAG TPA: dTDP-4-dehydrorhamnose reductase, partial [Candidatus Methylomirabilis sp.]
WVVHAAAATDVDGCERDPAMALAVNGEGTRRVAEGCRLAGAGLVYISTDFVFDGQKGSPYLEADVPVPVSAYGRSKLAGERAVQETAPRWSVVRTAWLYGVHGKNFVKTIMGKAAAGGQLRVVDDQVGSPTYARDLAAAIAQLLTRELTGVFHLTNDGSCSWFEFTREILRQGGFSATGVLPISSRELARPARRPAYSVLANGEWERAGLSVLRPWPQALAAMLEAWRAAGPAAVPVFPARLT